MQTLNEPRERMTYNDKNAAWSFVGCTSCTKENSYLLNFCFVVSRSCVTWNFLHSISNDQLSSGSPDAAEHKSLNIRQEKSKFHSFHSCWLNKVSLFQNRIIAQLNWISSNSKSQGLKAIRGRHIRCHTLWNKGFKQPSAGRPRANYVWCSVILFLPWKRCFDSVQHVRRCNAVPIQARRRFRAIWAFNCMMCVVCSCKSVYGLNFDRLHLFVLYWSFSFHEFQIPCLQRL